MREVMNEGYDDCREAREALRFVLIVIGKSGVDKLFCDIVTRYYCEGRVAE